MIHLVLAVSRPIVDEQSEAYKAGGVAGRIFFGLLVLLVLWKFVKWMRK
jgi:hypothetical protein